MPLLLDIPYSDKDEAMLLGAKWNAELNLWVIKKRNDYIKFAKWMIKGYDFVDIICDSIYIIERNILCPYCGKKLSLLH